jgi:flagellin
MRINTNVPSIQSRHRLIHNQEDLGVRLERLSTGLRINRGKDDPAGLIASETLRSEMGGIRQAIENSQRTINVLTVAESSLNEISSLLLDIHQLTNHAANDGAVSRTEQEADQLQIDSILEAIDRIANTTQFAGEKLINGNMAYTLSGVATSAIANTTFFAARVPDNGATEITVDVIASAQTAQMVFAGVSGGLDHSVLLEMKGTLGTEIIALTSGSSASRIAATVNQNKITTGISATVSGTGANTRVLLNSIEYGEEAFVSISPLEGDFLVSPGATTMTTGQDTGVLINGQTASTRGFTAQLRANNLDVEMELTKDAATRLTSSTFHITGGGAQFQIGPQVNPNGQISIGIPSVGSAHLGNVEYGFLNTIRGAGRNAVLEGNYAQAEKIVNKAISQVAVLRGRLGALQKNQVERNVTSQRVALENVMAAESAIRDADIAEETAKLTRSQILVQSTSMVLGIANQTPNNALALLG